MIRSSVQAQLLAVACVVLAATVALAQSNIQTKRVQFKRGATSAVVEGSIKGDQIVDYVVGARQGQSMNVSMATKHGATYFNILAPSQTEVALFNGSTNQNQYEGVLPQGGDYKIRIYMMRSAARRNEVAHYRLELSITGAGKQAAAPVGDARVAGTTTHATGDIPCAMGREQPTGACPFGVTRAGQGTGTVTVTKPDGRRRVIFFEKGKATGADVSQADPGEFRASREGDRTIVRIGDERYKMPDAVLFGG